MKNVSGSQLYFFCLKTGKFFVTLDRIDRVENAIQSMLVQLETQDYKIVPVKFAASVVGQIISTKPVLGKIVRLKTRELYKCIESRLSWYSPVYVSDKALAELQFWLSKLRGLNSKGRDISENTSFEVALFCDASSEGYGGYLESNIPYCTGSISDSENKVKQIVTNTVSADVFRPADKNLASPEVEVVSNSKKSTDDIASSKRLFISPEVEKVDEKSPKMAQLVSPEVETELLNRSVVVVSPEVRNGILNKPGLLLNKTLHKSPEVDLGMHETRETFGEVKPDVSISVIQHKTLSDIVSHNISSVGHEVIGVWQSEERAKSSTWREAEAVKRVLQSNKADIRGKKVKIYSDNKNVQSVLKVGSKKEELQTIAMEVSEICENNGINISVEWIPRELNERADYLSRCKDSDDWSIQDWVFTKLNSRWGPHTIDRFSSHYNNKCERYNSRWWVPGTQGVNALDQYWGKPEINWVVPPPRLIPHVLEKIQSDDAQCTLVIPDWPSAPFYTVLKSESVRMRVIETITLPRYNLIKAGFGNNGIFRREPLTFSMLALKIR